MNPALQKLAHAVPRALLVGGSVRDLLLGQEPKDFDVEVYGLTASQLQQVLEQLFGRVDIIGASFGVFKVWLEDGLELDVSLPRRESKIGVGHKGFMTESEPDLSIYEALGRRDFTINAMGLDLLTGEMHDPYHGQVDLKSGILRVVNQQTFTDDPLRVLRGIQLAARFNLWPDEESLFLMTGMVHGGQLEQLSAERITNEWKKLLLKSGQPSIGFKLMRELDLIKLFYPELLALINVPQEPEWHPEGDVWTHTLLALDAATKQRELLSEEEALILMLGVLCHDFGKPAVTRIIEGRFRSPGHEAAGLVPVSNFFARFKFGQRIEQMVLAITRDHLKPSLFYRQYNQGELREEEYVNAVRQLLKRLKGVPLNVYLAVTEADVKGRGEVALKRQYSAGDFLRDVVNRYNLIEIAGNNLLTGQELMKEFSFSEGQELGQMIIEIERARDAGEIATKEEARALVRKRLKV